MTVTVPAYAKINLFLDICSIRENGYHNIKSYMQSVSLHDDVSVTISPAEKKKINIFCDNVDIPCDSSNLAYKAANAYPVVGDITIKIEKRIPMSAGLAGGSADCAAVLVALNKLCGDKLAPDELCCLGSKLGADVPFCIRGGACLVEGIGEILTPKKSMPRFPLVIARKGEGMSTPLAYKALDEKFNNFEGYISDFQKIEALISDDDCVTAESYCKNLFNIFESVVEPERPCVTEIKRTMNAFGTAGTLMSGSGTAVFGIFEKEQDAQNAVEALKNDGAAAYLCYPV